MRTRSSSLIAVALSAVLVSTPASAATTDIGSWSTTPATLSAAGGSAYNPQLVVDGSNVIATWRRFDGDNFRIQAATSTDGGTTWSTTPETLSAASGNAYEPQLVVAGSTVIATWERNDGSNSRIQAATSTDGGTTWSTTPETLSAEGGDAYGPQLVADGSNVIATWYRFDGDNFRIQAAHSTDGGTTWSTTPETLSAAGGNAYKPQLVVDGSNVIATWRRFDGDNFRIQAATSTDGGTTWSTTPETLSAASGNANSAQLVADGSTVIATWNGYDDSNVSRIQAATSTDGGTTWSTTPATLSTAGGHAVNPQLVIDGGTVIATWQRYDGDNYRIQASSFTGTKPFTTAATAAITGVAKVGQTLTANMRRWWTWAPNPTTLTYAWRRTVGGSVLGTEETYTPTVADTGATLFVTVTAEKVGYLPKKVTSTATAAVTAGTFSITGTAQVGTVLKAPTGIWTDGTTLTYSWKRSGVTRPISAVSEYTPVIADIAKTLTVTVTAKRTGANTITATSTPTTAVLGQPFTTSPVPTITMTGAGTPVVGTKLTAVPGTWGPGTPPTFSYVWSRAASPTGTKTVIPRATLNTYTAVTADRGMYITVSVTAKKTGFANTTRISADDGTRIAS